MTRIIAVTFMTAFVGAIALPVQGNFPGVFFFNASDKYRDWYHDPLIHRDKRFEKVHRGYRLFAGARPTSEVYPYPDKKFVMTN